MVHLAVYQMEPAELPLLDQAEGLGNGYRHFELTLPRFGKVLTYMAQQSHLDDRLRPYLWYKEYVLAGAGYHGFEESYLQMIRQVPHWDDKEQDRHGRHMRRIQQFQSTPELEEQ